MAARTYLWLILAVIVAVYVVSYLSFSRSGYAWADRYDGDGFYYFPPEDTDAWRRKNFFCVYFFWPLNWIDVILGLGRSPASEPLWDLAARTRISPNSSLALPPP